MFLGEFKSKKPINLGRKTSQDKNELLRKAQLERDNRELERNQFAAILRLQVSLFYSFYTFIFIESMANISYKTIT